MKDSDESGAAQEAVPPPDGVKPFPPELATETLEKELRDADRASLGHPVISLFYYIALLYLGFHYLPNPNWDPSTTQMVIVIGVIGIWRYGWWMVHGIRSLIYTFIYYPHIRKKSDKLWKDPTKRPGHIYFQMTTYFEDKVTTRQVLASIVSECRMMGVPATLVVGTGAEFDEEVMDEFFEEFPPPDNFRYLYARQPEDKGGKRYAIGTVLKKVQTLNPGREPIVFMDGDSIFAPGALFKSVKILYSQNVAGVTTDEKAVIRGPRWVQHFFDMRFAVRNIQMRSVGLSRKLLALTGRMSVLWTDIACRDDFINIITEDHLDHWFWGRFRFLSGDDKSSWYFLLTRASEMLYVPDAMVYTVEQIDKEKTLERVSQNLLRWSGNMMRNGSRGLMLGPKKVGFFLWYCLIDQRIAMWTSISGLFAALAFTVSGNYTFIIGFLLWIMTTRILQCCLLWYYNGKIDMTFPFLLYFNQIVGSWLKIYMMFRLPMQRWANRKGQAAGFGQYGKKKMLFASYMNMTCLALFAVVILILTGLLKVPDFLNIINAAIAD